MGLGKKKILVFLDFFVEGGGKGSEWDCGERAGICGVNCIRGPYLSTALRCAQDDNPDKSGCEPRVVGMWAHTRGRKGLINIYF